MSGPPDHVRSFALQFALHECGHYIVARWLGFKTIGITLEMTGNSNHDGSSSDIELFPQPKKIQTTSEVIEYLQQRIVILFAGCVAQSLHANSSAPDLNEASNCLKQNGVDDHRIIQELLHLLRNIQYPPPTDKNQATSELKCISDRLWEEAIRAVTNNQQHILALRDRLLDDLKCTGKGTWKACLRAAEIDF